MECCVEEGQRSVGDLELADGDVVRQLVTEVGLQLRAVFALWLGEDFDIDGGVVEAGGDAEAIFAHRQGGWLGSRCAVPVTCLVQPTAASSRHIAITTTARDIRMSTALLWCARYAIRGRGIGRTAARGFCVSYPCRQPCRQSLMGRSWRARCNRRRVLPPECQWRYQLGASGDRASPPHRSRGPRHRPGHAAGRAARRQGSRRYPCSPRAVADVPQDHLATAGRATAPHGGRAARIRSGRGAFGVAGAARLRGVARRAPPRCADRRRIPNRHRGFRRKLRHRLRRTRRVGVDASPARPRRPHAGTVDGGDGKP